MPFSKRSISNLKGVHPHLQAIMEIAMERRDANPERCSDFMIVEGLRSYQRQAELLEQGATWTMNSRHLTGHAVDVVPLDSKGKASYAWPLYYPVADLIKEATNVFIVNCQSNRVPGFNDETIVDDIIQWGGDWSKGKKDGPHWELQWSRYPIVQGKLKI